MMTIKEFYRRTAVPLVLIMIGIMLAQMIGGVRTIPIDTGILLLVALLRYVWDDAREKS